MDVGKDVAMKSPGPIAVNGGKSVNELGTLEKPRAHSPKIVQSVCIQYDFEKKPETPVAQPSNSQGSSLLEYMRRSQHEPIPNGVANGSAVKSNGRFVTPLSPESQKRELCTYLQLMKPTEQKERVVYCRTLRGRKIDKVPELKKENKCNKLMPLPPEAAYSEICHFDDAILDLVQTTKLERSQNLAKKRKKSKIYRRLNLRSKLRLRSMFLRRLILKRSNTRKKERRKILDEYRQKSVEANNSSFVATLPEVVAPKPAKQNIVLKNFVDDMLELDKMSEAHRKSVIESRILTSQLLNNFISEGTNEEDVQRAFKIFSDLANRSKGGETPVTSVISKVESVGKGTEEACNVQIMEGNKENNLADVTQEPSDYISVVVDAPIVIQETCAEITIEETGDVQNLVMLDHNYVLSDENPSSGDEEDDDDCQEEIEEEEEIVKAKPPSPVQISPVTTNDVPSLHRSLMISARRKRLLSNLSMQHWDPKSETTLKHSIKFNKLDGKILNAFYQDYNLILVQETSVSFWTQSALGAILEAENMWVPKGNAQRIPLNGTYFQKRTQEMLISTDTSLAYIELWIKEHKSELREVPMADIFATVYFQRMHQQGLEKKALQLQNIQGLAENVQYCVMRFYNRIIVSWQFKKLDEMKTKVQVYHLAADFQTVANVYIMQPVQHHVASLHTVEDCNTLVMGCGESKITLWNLEYGYIVSTIELANIQQPASPLCVKCDRGYLFTIQESIYHDLVLIAINGLHNSWKKLQSFTPPSGFTGLREACLENGIVLAYYKEGILGWNTQTGELIIEEIPQNYEYIPSGKNVIILTNDKVFVKYSLSHLISQGS